MERKDFKPIMATVFQVSAMRNRRKDMDNNVKGKKGSVKEIGDGNLRGSQSYTAETSYWPVIKSRK